MIYLDNAATTFPKPEPVYRALDEIARQHMGNAWHPQHGLAAEAEAIVEGARGLFDRVFGGDDPRRWVHTFNGTDSLNIALKCVLGRRDRVVMTDLEHDSVSRPLHSLEREGTIKLVEVTSQDGYLDPDDLRKALKKTTRLVALNHASNVTGSVQALDEIAPIVRDAGALLLLDATQSAGLVPIDLKRTPIDLLAISGHKYLYGPTGTGMLWVGPRADPRPWREGDSGGSSKGESQPEELPYRLEAGTPNVLGVAGLAAGVRWTAAQGPETLRAGLVARLQAVVDWCSSTGLWRVVGRWEPAAHAGALSLLPAKERDLAEVSKALDRRFAIAVKAGLQDAPLLHHSLGTAPGGTLRISPGPFTSASDIEILLRGLEGLA